MQLANTRFAHWGIDQKDPVWQSLHDFTSRPILITGSSVANILGFGYQNCTRVWQYYTGARNAADEIDDFQQKLYDYGHQWEPFAAKAFMNAYPIWCGVQPGFLYDKKHSWLGVSLDYICTQDLSYLDFQGPSKLLNLEIKCRPMAAIPIPHTIAEVPVKHVIQCQIQMHVTGIADSCLFFFKEGQHSAWHIKKDDAFWTGIEPFLIKFREYVTSNTQPPRGGFKKQVQPFVNAMMQNLKPFQGSI